MQLRIQYDSGVNPTCCFTSFSFFVLYFILVLSDSLPDAQLQLIIIQEIRDILTERLSLSVEGDRNRNLQA